MKKTHILTLILMLTVSVAFGQTPYKLNYPDITIGNSPTGKIVLNGSNLRLPRIATSSAPDSLLALVDGKVVKVAMSEIASNLTFSNGLTKTGNNVSLGGALNSTSILDINNNAFVVAKLSGTAGAFSINNSGSFIGTATNGVSINQISFENSGAITLRDNINSSGIKNAAKYRNGLTGLSIMDKDYIDSVANAASTSGVTSVNGRTGAVTGLAEANSVVTLSGAQNVAGVKSFSSNSIWNDGVNPQTLTAKSNGIEFSYLLAPTDIKVGFNANGHYIENTDGRVSETLNLSGAPYGGISFTKKSTNKTINLVSPINIVNGGTIKLRDTTGTIALLSDITGAGGSYELLANKSTTLSSPNNTTYPTTLAVSNALTNETLQTVTSRGATTNQPIIVNNTFSTTGSLRVGATTGNNLLIDPNPGGNVKIRAFNNGSNQALEYVGGEHVFDGQLTLLSNISVPSYRANDFVINHENSAQKISLQNAGTTKLEVLSTGVRVNNLSGTGPRMVGVDATGLLTAQGLVSSYANANGSNATGTWPISVNGNSATTTKWGGIEADFTQFGVNLFGFLAYNEFGMGRAYSVSQVKSALGIGNPPFETSGTSATLVSSGRYIPQNAALTIYTLPTTANVGDVIFINGKGAGGWRISQNTGQVIHGATDTTIGSAGFVASTARYNSIAIVCVTANTEWIIQSSQGSLTIN